MNTEEQNLVHKTFNNLAESCKGSLSKILLKIDIAEQANTLFGWSAIISIVLFLLISLFTEFPLAGFTDAVVKTLTPVFFVFSLTSIISLFKRRYF